MLESKKSVKVFRQYICSNMVEVTKIPREQNENMDDILLKLIEQMVSPRKIFCPINITHKLSNTRNAGIIIKLSTRSSRDKFLL